MENKSFAEFLKELIDTGFHLEFQSQANFIKNARSQYIRALDIDIDNMVYDLEQEEVSHETI